MIDSFSLFALPLLGIVSSSRFFLKPIASLFQHPILACSLSNLIARFFDEAALDFFKRLTSGCEHGGLAITRIHRYGGIEIQRLNPTSPRLYSHLARY